MIAPYMDARVVDDNEIEGRISLPGFTDVVAKGFETGPISQTRQLVLVLPTETYGMARGELVVVARAVQ